MKASLLLIEDEVGLAKVVESTLEQAGYKVRHVKSSDAALSALKQEAFDLILSDIQLPGLSGLQLLEILKKEERIATIPVIMLTVLGDTPHKVQGLHKGADDYLVKPFSGEELVARVGAVLRRSRGGGRAPSNTLSAGAVSVDLDRMEALLRGKKMALTQSELDLLALLVKHKGYVLSYQSLAESLSIGGNIVTSETLYVHVKNLRKKMGEDGKSIETVHGIGYKFSE